MSRHDSKAEQQPDVSLCMLLLCRLNQASLQPTEVLSTATGGSGLLSCTTLGAAASQPLHSAAPPGEKLRAVTLDTCTWHEGAWVEDHVAWVSPHESISKSRCAVSQ